MNAPYPTHLQLRAESAIGALLAEQATATEAFRAIVATAQAGIAVLHFPLGSPAHGFDLEDITERLKQEDKILAEMKADEQSSCK